MARRLVAMAAEATTARVVAVARRLVVATAAKAMARAVAVARRLVATAAKAMARTEAVVRLLARRRSTARAGAVPPQARGRAAGASFGKRHRQDQGFLLLLQGVCRWMSLHNAPHCTTGCASLRSLRSLRIRGT